MENIKNKSPNKVFMILAFRLLIGLLITYGHYVKINSSRITSILLRAHCICVSILTIFGTSLVPYFDYIVIDYFILVIYQMMNIYSQITSRLYLSTYTSKILTCDFLMNYPKKVLNIPYYVFIVLLLGMFTSVACFLCDMLFSPSGMQLLRYSKYGWFWLTNRHFVVYAIELNIYTIVYVVGTMHSRLMQMRLKLERNTVPVNIIGKNEIMLKLRVVRKCLINYSNLLDAFDEIDSHMQLSMITTLLTNTPLLITFAYILLKVVVFNVPLITFTLINVLRVMALTTAPCAFSELCHNEMDQLKEVLSKQIIKCSDSELRAELQCVFDYITRRPFSFTLLRAVHVNIHLPVTIFALVITSVILMIQFSHFSI